MVLDRLFLWIFTVAVLVGTAGIILQAPTLYDDRQPLDTRLSEIGLATARPMAGVNKHWKLTKKNKKKNKDIPRTFFVAFRRVVSFFYQCLPFFFVCVKRKISRKKKHTPFGGTISTEKIYTAMIWLLWIFAHIVCLLCIHKKDYQNQTYIHTYTWKKDELQ